MKLLFATYKNKWINDLFRNYYYLIKLLVEKYDFKLIDLSDYKLNTNFNAIISEYENIESILVIENHNSILIYHIFNNFFENSIKKYIVVDDFHKFKKLKIKNYYSNFDKIFVTYYNPFLKLYPNVDSSKVIWCPHGHTEDFLINFNKQPVNKIFLSGAIGPIYPMRTYMLKLYKRGYGGRINYLPHPGYISFDYGENIKPIDIKAGKSYASIINDHICCFTDCSEYEYVLLKYFEIPATGSLLLAVNPQDDKLEKLGFIDGVNYINCTCENLKEKINWILDIKNRNLVDKIRKNGMELVRSKHSIEIRAKLINEYICNEMTDIIAE